MYVFKLLSKLFNKFWQNWGVYTISDCDKFIWFSVFFIEIAFTQTTVFCIFYIAFEQNLLYWHFPLKCVLQFENLQIAPTSNQKKNSQTDWVKLLHLKLIISHKNILNRSTIRSLLESPLLFLVSLQLFWIHYVSKVKKKKEA